MPNSKPTFNENRNPETYQKHKKEVFWQITMPFVVLCLLFLFLAVFSASFSNYQRVWADISLIWLLMPNLILALFAFLLLVALIYGLSKLIGILPNNAKKVQGYLKIVFDLVKSGDDRMVEPFIRGKSSTASFKKLFEQLFQR